MRRFYILLLLCGGLALLFLPVHAVTPADEAFTVARQLLDTGNDQQAITAFRKFLKDFPKDERGLEATLLLGYGLMNTNQYAPALVEFARVIEKTTLPDQAGLRADALFQSAECQARQGDHAKAAQAYQACIAIPAPANRLYIDAHYWLADSLTQLNRIDEARAAYSRVLELDAKHPLAGWSLYGRGALNLRAQQYDAAIADFEGLIARYGETEPARPARFQVASSYAARARAATTDELRAGDVARAETLWLALEKDGTVDDGMRRQTQLALAQLYLDANDAGKAEAAYARALTGLPADSEEALTIRLRRAHALYNADRFPEAAQEYKLVAEQQAFPVPALDALYWQGNALYQIARRDERDAGAYTTAITVLQRVVAAPAIDAVRAARTTLLIAICREAQFLLGDAAARDTALESYRQLIKQWPQSPEAAEVPDAVQRLTAGMDAAALANVLATFPEGVAGAAATLQLARAQYRDGNYQLALTTTQGLLKGKISEALLPQANLLLGACYLRLSRPTDAIKPYETALEKATGDAERRAARYGITQAYLELRQYDRAIAAALALQQLPPQQGTPVERDTEMAERWDLLAQAYIGAKQYSDARAAYQRLQTDCPLSPLLPQALLASGWLAEQEAQPQQAERYYREAIDKYPTHQVKEEAILRLATLYLGQKNYQQMIDILPAIPEASPQADHAAFLLAWGYHGLGEKEQASQTFMKLSERHPDSSYAGESLYRAGEYQAETGHYPEAQALFTRALAALSEDHILKPVAAFMIGSSAYNAEAYPEAVSAYDVVIGQYPASAVAEDAAFWKAQALEATGKTRAKEARTAYEQYAAKYPTGQYRLDALVGVGRAMLLAEEYAAARAALGIALQQCKGAQTPPLSERAKNLLPEIQYHLGKSHAAQQQYAEALQAYALIAGYNLEPWYSRSLLEMARCSAQLQDKEAARRTLRLLRDKFPQSDAAKDAVALAQEYDIALD